MKKKNRLEQEEGKMEYIELIAKCVLFYAVIVCALRLMGKREVGELSVLDMVIYFVMSEILALTISEPNETIIKALLAIITLVILQRSVAWTCLKKKKWRDFFEGTPNLIIQNGIIDQKAMRQQRYTIDDLMFQLRDKEVGSPEEVQFAILENSGVLTVLKKKDCKLVNPQPLIADGILQKEALIQSGIQEAWLKEKLKEEGCSSFEEVFLCLLQKDHLFVLKKENPDHMK